MQAEKKWSFIRFLITALFLYAVWLLFTASIAPYSLIFGALGSLLIAALTYNVFIARHQANLKYIIPNPINLILYICILIFFIYRASFSMVRSVVTGKSSPRIVHFRTRLKSDMARMVLANSITLTPGTITVDLNDDHLTVHWFCCNTNHTKLAGERIKGRMERFIGGIWL